jgi:hypothetical protein
MASTADASTGHAPGTCVLDGTHASVHFLVSTEPGTAKGQLAGVAINHLSTTGCADPLPATVTIRGIPSGDSTAIPTETLTVLDSAKDPCTGTPLSSPIFLVNGAITLRACPTSGPGHYANVLDATRLILRVAGKPVTVGDGTGSTGPATSEGPGVTVLGEKATRHTDSHGHHSEDRASVGLGDLPFTGGWIARTVSLSLALVLLGLVLVLVRRRRTNPSRPDGQ